MTRSNYIIILILLVAIYLYFYVDVNAIIKQGSTEGFVLEEKINATEDANHLFNQYDSIKQKYNQPKHQFTGFFTKL